MTLGTKDHTWLHMATSRHLTLCSTPPLSKDSEGYKALLSTQLIFLLETEWVKPTIINSTSSRVGRRSVNVVETIVEGNRVDFVFDQKSHLPVQVRYYDVPRTHAMSDYTNVDGIMMPTKIDYGEGKYKVRIELNVQYDESIFVKPPPMEAGPEAWRPKQRSR